VIGKPTLTVLATAVVALAVLLLPAASARAGCGCDHPPPDWAMVMPPFGSPGALIHVFADGGEFVPGEAYGVKLGDDRVVTVLAEDSTVLEVLVPGGLALGPVEIEVNGPGYNRVYPGELFTALPPARAVPPGTGSYLNTDYEVAIAADGTMLIPMDVGAVLDPTQFAMAFADLPLAFDGDDIVIYNADGVDLTLFTLDVDDPTQHEWGDYYGWEVEQDAGLYGVPYQAEATNPFDLTQMSSILTYWRHEFYTYAAAHAPGGSHEVDEDGRHPDGTMHVDHEHLVLAISGLERDESEPLDLGQAESLAPGSRVVDLIWASVVSPVPIAPSAMAVAVQSSVGQNPLPLPLADVGND
jgi:hypothetical protein